MQTKTNKYPKLPSLSGNNRERVFTKHWANLPLHLDKNEMAILSFITYQCKADNTFKYSTELVQRYAKAVRYANEEYNGAVKVRMPNGITVTPWFIRVFIERLIEQGWLLSTGKRNEYMVNPMLSYVPYYVSKEQYKEVCLVYNTRPADVVELFKGIVNPKIKNKKSQSKHIYWPE